MRRFREVEIPPLREAMPGWSPGSSGKVEVSSFTAPEEFTPMSEDRLPLAELLQKSGDGDLLRSIAEAVLQLLMEADVEGLVGAGRRPARAFGRAADLAQRLS